MNSTTNMNRKKTKEIRLSSTKAILKDMQRVCIGSLVRHEYTFYTIRYVIDSDKPLESNFT
jgi:hypothetical protein